MKHFLPCIALSAVLLGGCGDTRTPPEVAPQASDSAEMARAADVAAPSGSSSEQTRTQDGYALPARDGWWRNLPRPIWRDYPTVKTLNPWFDVHQIRDGVFALYESGQQAEAISWLIVGSRQALLFDTGTGMGDIRSVVRQLTRLPVMVINSHSHYAHVGGNHQFDDVLSLNHPLVRERAKGLSNDEVGRYAAGDAIWKPVPPNLNALDYTVQGWGFSRWIDNGQLLDLGGVRLEVLRTPGHSPDSLVLVDRGRRLLFTGDTFLLDKISLTGSNSDVLDFADSAAKLAALAGQIDLLLMAHKTPVAEARFLSDLDQAMQGILNEAAPFERDGNRRIYRFRGFSIATLDPPIADDAIIDAL